MADPVARYDCAARSKMDKDFYFETGIESLRLSGKEKFMIQSEEVSCGLQVFAALELVEV